MRETPGQVATCSAGVLGVVVDCFPAAVGIQLVTTQGAMHVDIVSAPVTGRSASCNSGVIVPEIAAPAWSWGLMCTAIAGIISQYDEIIVNLTGQLCQPTPGVLSTSTSESAAPLGRSATCAAGVMVPAISAPLTGMVFATIPGSLAPSLVFALTGQAATATPHGMSVLIDKMLLGATATASRGTLGNTHGCTIFVTGFQLYFNTGDVTRGFPKVKAENLLWAQQEVEKLFVQQKPDESFPIVLANE
jgi:hypothetical protein